MMITLMVTVLDDGDRFGVADKIIILATFFVMLVIFVTNILTLSPTSFTCHQHIWSQTSITNIDIFVEL